MSDPFFFGYGSLVNRKTHTYPSCEPARLRGWKRTWRHTSLRAVAYLTVVPDAQSEISGLIAKVPDADWASLDEREHAYERSFVSDSTGHPLKHAPEIHVYAIPENRHNTVCESHPILLSYLDAVLQGYLNEFGVEGAREFFETTSGWDAPIRDDRIEPIYPRHQTLARKERVWIDNRLEDIGAKIMR